MTMTDELRPPMRTMPREEEDEHVRYLLGVLAQLRREYDLRAAPIIEALVRYESMRAPRSIWILDPSKPPSDFDPTKS